MIVLTVKTLDSQNHIFSVDDDITVEQFKTKIANTVNIPPDTQRIIYCGRVLQDSSKLSDYDVNGKVVHLVQRPPPAQNPPTTRSSSPPPRRGFRGFETGNTMYLGSMAFPSNLMESQGIVPPPPTHSLAGSRLNVARRMLRRAEAVITLLENPTARPSEQANTEEQPEEEVTPIIEARVIVPRGNNETIDEAMVLSAVQNTLFDAASGALPMGAEVTIDASGSSSESPPADSAASTPEEAATASGESSGTNQQRPAGVSARTLAENASRTSEMAELLSTLNQLQARFTPFLDRYRQFMINDPIIQQEHMRQTQAMLGRVSEVLHFLGHAYHSLSDIIIRVRTPPPRPLLCRPILIQHSAVVQAGIPIQVEAQFNLSTERPNASTTSSTATTNTETVTTTASTVTNQSTTAQTPTTSSRPTQPTINFRGFPILPGASMHIQALRAGGRPVNLNASPRPQNNNNNTVGGSPSTATTTSTNTTTSTTTPGAGANFVLPNLNNSSVEFFMEVTPEVLQGGMNGPPPEFLQSLVQMAGQIMSRVATSNAGGNAPSTTSTSTTTASPESSATNSSADSSQSNVPSSTAASGQNSQARGNTQTHPTTATHTRSTPRPHVHLAQQAMQGGFDPFLPCNSHHVTHRRRHQSAARQQQQQQQQSQSAQQQSSSQQTAQNNRERPQESGTERGEEDTSQNIHNLFDEIYNSLRLAYRRNRGWDSTNRTQPSLPPTLAQHAFIADFTATQSIARLLQQVPGEDEAPSMSDSNPPGTLINDLIYMLSRTLTLVDMVAISTANYEPLVRIRDDIREFVITRLVDGPMAPDTINLGVNTLLTELGPFFQHFARLNVRDNVDIVRSLESLFRERLPEIFACAIQLTSDEWVPHLVELCISLVKTMFALALNVSANGQQGVEETFTHIISAYMQGVPDDLREWTTNISRENLRQFLNGISVDDSSIESFIVRRNQDVAMETASAEAASQEPKASGNESEQPMELDEPAASAVSAGNAEGASAAGSLNLSDDQEALPAVVVGSEQWHGEVPDDWVPIITRDVNRQRRQNPQAPFSDAYLSGMPTKRRKIVNSTKPQGSLPQVIADSVRRAVTATGLSTVTPVETVAQAAGDSSEVQTAYRNLLRTTVQTALRDNEDFTPERFPNASTYFKPQ